MDQISTTARTPRKIAIYVGTFYTAPMDRNGKLGGSEIMALDLAGQLISRGHLMVIYGALNSHTATVCAGETVEVECRNWERMRGDRDKFDVLILSRFVYALEFYKDNLDRFGKIIYWMHDAHPHDMSIRVGSGAGGQLVSCKLPNYGMDLLLDYIRRGRLEQVICVSQWQRELQTSYFKLPVEFTDKIQVIHNAVPDKLFDMQTGNKKPHSFVYTTDPARAMGPIIESWPEIRANWPDATMDVMFYGEVKPELVAQMRATPGFTWHGGVSSEEVYRRVAAAEVYYYPSLSHETFGLSTVQASALGCKVIARRYSGLAETGEAIGSILLPADGGSVVVGELLDRPVDGLERIRTYERFAWKNIACEWVARLT